MIDQANAPNDALIRIKGVKGIGHGRLHSGLTKLKGYIENGRPIDPNAVTACVKKNPAAESEMRPEI